MTPEERLRRYAELAVRVGANVQTGQDVVITCLVEHAEIARAIAREAKAVGIHINFAPTVDVNIKGVLYGIAVYFVMNYVVIPLSAASQGTFSMPVFLNGILIHAFGVGLPAALFARAAQTRTIH